MKSKHFSFFLRNVFFITQKCMLNILIALRLMPTNVFDSYRGLISDGRVSYHIDPSPELGPGHHKLYIEPDDPVQRRGMSLSCLWLLTQTVKLS